MNTELEAGLVDRTQAWFGPDGPLQQTLEHYSIRNEQLQMASAVASALESRETLIVEAGTGTGKSLAYLVPALLSGGKVIVSTGTKNLQDQLFRKDLPMLLGLARHPVSLSLLKGRANYLCVHRLKLAQADTRLHRLASQVYPTLRNLREWGLRSPDGDLNAGDAPNLGAIPLARVTSSTENCLGAECPEYHGCFVVKARRRAQEADIVVVNHHLLLADLALREEGFAELLPDADAVILDEAHQLPQVANQFFGKRYSYYQLADLARDLRAELREHAADMPELRDCLADYEEACARLLQQLAAGNIRQPWLDAVRNTAVRDSVEDFRHTTGEVLQALEPARVRSKGLEQATLRMKAVQNFFLELLEADKETDPDKAESLIRWVERGDRNFILHLTPLDIADNFRQIMKATPAAWILTSATLSVDNRFAHFAAQIGADSARELILESPFDYRNNSLLYLPEVGREPNHPAYLQAVAESMLPVIASAEGGAFVLCTSLNAVSFFASYLRGRLPQQVLTQGDTSRHTLLERFRDDGHAILVGTSSFWEGVDVRGPALRLVIIDRLPFAHPDEPILKARLETIRRQGGNPFGDYQVPQAVITLKQGVGRLIRDTSDRGVVMLCDPRLKSRGYGKRFLDSLPPMPHTRSFHEVRDFLQDRLTRA